MLALGIVLGVVFLPLTIYVIFEICHDLNHAGWWEKPREWTDVDLRSDYEKPHDDY